MKSRVQKWGNSLALRIPKGFASEAHIEQNTVVELSLVGSKLIVEPVSDSTFELKQLLAGVSDQNLHREVNTGPALGNEVW